MTHRFEAASGTLDDREGVLLELRDADGTTGIGEASPMASLGGGTCEDVLRLLKAHGGALDGALDVTLDALSDDQPGVAALRCAVDMALLDLEGRASGRSVAELLTEPLGETPASAVLVNAVLGDGASSEVVAYAQQAVQSGYAVLKLKVGVGALEHDLALVAGVREACPDAVVRLDANGAWGEDDAGEAIDRLATAGVELLEQPVAAADVEAFARLRERAAFRLAADEAVSSSSLADRVIELRAADLLVLKPMVLGGVRPALALAQRAALAGIGSFVTTTFDSSVGTAAALHLAAALPWDAAQGLGTGDHLAGDVVTSPLRPVDGSLAVAGPGLGVELDAAALAEVATGEWHEVRS
jgi:o-succinylbenzoate synthase